MLSLLFPSVFILRNIIVLSPAKEKYNGRRQKQGNLRWNQKPVSKSREMLVRLWNHKRLIFQSMRFIALTFWKKSIKQKRVKSWNWMISAKFRGRPETHRLETLTKWILHIMGLLNNINLFYIYSFTPWTRQLVPTEKSAIASLCSSSSSCLILQNVW